jgi:Ca-activated chloride channel family protein
MQLDHEFPEKLAIPREEGLMRVRMAVVSVFLILLVSLVHGAMQASVLSGVVTDSSGAAIPGLQVTVTAAGASAPMRTMTTDDNGRFFVLMLVPGTYEVTFEFAGFKTERRTIEIMTGRPPVVLSVVMGVGQLAETITVSSEAPRIQVSQASVGPQMESLSSRFNREEYRHTPENDFKRVSAHPLSTFSIDADTASYSNVRRFLNDDELPPDGAVRVEELINYFRFDYASPTGDAPVGIVTEVSRCPWNSKHLLALVGVRAKDLQASTASGSASRAEAGESRQPLARNFVFLLDVSGSMSSPDKLPLVKQSLALLVEQLTPRDRVAIVVYAGASGLVLPSTSGADKAQILAALERLNAGGSTNGGEGIKLAYQTARKQFAADAVNRVILVTDGDFNVGLTSEDQLVGLIEHERKSGVFLSVLGVGTGNIDDITMEALADKGNGNYAYLDSLKEARKVLVRESDATLVTVAKDVKIQVEFNPREVAAYRLIGYENRLLDDQDFNDDAKDAGEIGAGKSVTALYEIVPAGEPVPGVGDVDRLKYQKEAEKTRASRGGEMMTIKLRYKRPDGGRSQKMETVVNADAAAPGRNLGFASAVAEFGMLLRKSRHAGDASFARVVARARQFRGDDPHEDRAEFITLVEKAGVLFERSKAGQSSQNP